MERSEIREARAAGRWYWTDENGFYRPICQPVIKSIVGTWDEVIEELKKETNADLQAQTQTTPDSPKR